MSDRLLIFTYLEAVVDAGWVAMWTGPQRGFMLAFLRFIDRDGVAFVGVKKLSEIMGSNERNTARTRASLIKDGYLAVQEAVPGRPTKYRLIMPPPAQRDMAQKDMGSTITPGAVRHGSESPPPAQAAMAQEAVPAQDGSDPRRRMVSTPGAVRHPNSIEQLINTPGLSADKHSLNGKTKTSTRGRDLIWDNVADIWFNGNVAEPDRTRVGRIVRDLKAHGATPDEIHRRLATYRAKHPTWVDTPEAIVKHWASLAPSAAGGLDPETEAHFLRKAAGEAITLPPEKQKDYDLWLADRQTKRQEAA